LIFITGCDRLVADWAGERLGRPFHLPYIAFGFSKDGNGLDGAVVLNSWNRSNIDISFYGPGTMARSSIRFTWDYVFNQLGAHRMTARTARSNKRMQNLCRRLGFTFETVAKRYYGPSRDEDAIVLALFREQAEKWMK